MTSTTTTTVKAPVLVGVVLSDGAVADAGAAVMSAVALVDRVLVLERHAASVGQHQVDGSHAVLCDWHDGEQAGAALTALGDAWVFVLDASERLELGDTAALRAAVATATTPLGIERADGGAEVRLAPISDDVLGIIGGPSTNVAPGVRLLPGEEVAPSLAPASAALPTVQAVDRPLGERHLVIVWEAAGAATPAIVEDLAAHFHVRARVGMSWSQRNFGSNLSRFYGQKLPADGEKAQHIGTGPFEAILIEDPSPAYAAQMTSSGIDVVNVNVLGAKNRYRSVTGLSLIHI